MAASNRQSALDDRGALFQGVLRTIGCSLDVEDGWSHACHGHSARVGFLAWRVAERLGLPDAPLAYYGGLLHDLGAIGFEEHVADFALREAQDPTFQSHPVIGCRLLADRPLLVPLVPLVESHHERIDGAGFPHGMYGDQIPIASSVIHLADAIDVRLRGQFEEPRAACRQVLARLREGAVSAHVAEAGEAVLLGEGGILEILRDGPRLVAAQDNLIVPFPGIERYPRATLLGELLTLLARVVDARHHARVGHSARVAFYAFKIAQAVGADLVGKWDAAWAGLLHDVGTFFLPRRLLGWGSPGSPGERALVEDHASRSGEIVARLPGLAHLAPMVAAHHERWDGLGYPLRLAGERIPLGARILAWADRYAILTALSGSGTESPHCDAMNALSEEVGSVLDPHLAPAALGVLERFGSIRPNFAGGAAQWRELLELEAPGVAPVAACPAPQPHDRIRQAPNTGALLVDLEPWRQATLGADFQIHFGEEDLARTTGLPASKRFLDHLGDDSRALIMEAVANLGPQAVYTHYLFTPVGRPFEVLLQRNDQGGFRLLFRSAENRLSTIDRLAHFYRNFLASSESVVFTDPDGWIIDVNRAFLDLFGYSLREVVGKHTRILGSGHQSPVFYKQLWAAITDPAVGSWTGEVVDRRRDGSLLQVFMRISTVRSPSGGCLGYIAHHTDISERKRAEAEIQRRDEELRRKNRELEQLSQFKTDVVAMTSHDLKSPLASISGLVTMIQRNLGRITQNELAGYLARIGDTASGMNGFITDLLDLERIESGTLKLDFGRIHVAALVGRCAEQIRSATQGRHRVTVAVVPDVLPMLADASRIEQVLGNLLANAAKFAPEGSTIGIAVTEPGVDRLRIVVEDEGPGIPTVQIDSVFERYVQADSVRASKRNSGVGLGLSIVRSLVLLHGGTVWVENRAPHGCRFVIDLPARRDDERLRRPVALLRDCPDASSLELVEILQEAGVVARRVSSFSEMTAMRAIVAPELVFVARSFLDAETLAHLERRDGSGVPLRVLIDDRDHDPAEPMPLDVTLTPPILEEEVRALLARFPPSR